MNRKPQNTIGTLAILLIVLAGTQLAGGFELDWSTIDGGGVMWSTGGDYKLSGTIGQPDAGSSSGGAYVLHGGFWHSSPDTPGDPPSPHDRRTNRFLSFLPDDEGTPLAYQVELVAVGPAECYDNDPTNDVGLEWWVTEPVCTDTDGNVVSPPCTGEDVWRSRLDPNPQPLSVWPQDVVHIADCEVVPIAEYEITAYDGLGFSAPQAIGTIQRPDLKCWADCVGEWDGAQWTPPNQVVNMDDVMAAVFYFKQVANKPHRIWVEVDDEAVNMVLNFTDIQRIVQGFKGETYPFRNPAACP